MRKFLYLLLVLPVLFFSLVACEQPTSQPALTVESISLNEGYKTEYLVGESIDLSTFKITVTYSDDSEKVLNVTKDMLSNVDMNTVGPKEVTVTYEGKSDSFIITVNPQPQEEVVLESIRVKGSYITEYNVGDELDLSDMILVLTYSDLTTEEIAVTSNMLGEVDMNVGGPKQVTVTYEGKTTTFSILVNEEEVIKADPTVEFLFEAGESFVMGGSEEPTFVVTPSELTYSVRFERNEAVVGSTFNALTEVGTYAIIVTVNGNDEYNTVEKWTTFKVKGSKLDATIEVSIENGTTLYIGVDSAPTVTVTPSNLDYEIIYTKDDGAVELGSEFPTEPGTYAINVRVNETDEYNYTSTFRWFVLKEVAVTEVVKVDPVFEENSDGALVFVGFIDENGESITLDSQVYTVHYEKSEVPVGSAVPTEPGSYSVVVSLDINSNYEFITLNIATLTSKIWRTFKIAAPVTKLNPEISFNVENGDELVIGEWSALVTVSSGVEYTVFYTMNDGEINLGSELPTTPGTYAINVKTVENNEYNAVSAFRWFRLVEPTTTEVKEIILVTSTDENGVLVFEGFKDLEGNTVAVSSDDYTAAYEKDEVSVSYEDFVSGEWYALVVGVNSAKYKLVKDGEYGGNSSKVWPSFQFLPNDSE